MLEKTATTTPAPPVADGLPWEKRRWAIAAIFTALAMASLNTAIANIALPAISADLHVSPAEVVWVVSACEPLRFRSRLRRPPPLVVLCDVSGSMGRYSEMLLHFLHALLAGRERVHAFLFATRLTPVTRLLRRRLRPVQRRLPHRADRHLLRRLPRRADPIGGAARHPAGIRRRDSKRSRESRCPCRELPLPGALRRKIRSGRAGATDR